MSEPMTNETLRERVSQWCPFDYMGPPEKWAAALLADIGLDRVDLAVERAAEALWKRDHGAALFGHGEASSPTYLRGIYRAAARAVLEAALTQPTDPVIPPSAEREDG